MRSRERQAVHETTSMPLSVERPETPVNSSAWIGACAHRELSCPEDFAIAEAVMDLQLQRSSYQAALATFARSPQTSLLDFLQ